MIRLNLLNQSKWCRYSGQATTRLTVPRCPGSWMDLAVRTGNVAYYRLRKVVGVNYTVYN